MYICANPNRILILENFGDYDISKSLFVYDQKDNLIDEIASKDNSSGLFTEVVSRNITEISNPMSWYRSCAT